MGSLIDSSVLIEAERGRLDLPRLAAQNPQETFSISAITASELLHGVYRAVRTAQRARRMAFVEGLLAAMPVLPFDLAVARIHAELWAEMRKRGGIIGQMDSMIGATALAWDLTVVTCDRRSFAKVPGLRVEVVPLIS
jgi:tRNA(fMet)-specific endonuclease VapC